jgi:hypothetical protein
MNFDMYTPCLSRNIKSILSFTPCARNHSDSAVSLAVWIQMSDFFVVEGVRNIPVETIQIVKPGPLGRHAIRPLLQISYFSGNSSFNTLRMWLMKCRWKHPAWSKLFHNVATFILYVIPLSHCYYSNQTIFQVKSVYKIPGVQSAGWLDFDSHES